MKALALTGGGSRGAYQIGALKKIMSDQGMDYKILCGISVGALHVASLSQTPYGQPSLVIEQVENFWINNVSTKSVYKRWFPFGKFHGLWQKSLFDNSPLHETFRKSFDPELAMNSERHIAVGAVNMNTGKTLYVRETHSKFMDFVLASASFPVFFQPVEIDNQLWFDGGVKEVTPLGQAIKMGATEIDLIVTERDLLGSKDWISSSHKAFPNQLVRTIEIMQHRMLKRDIEITSLKNKLSTIDPKFRNVKVRILIPSENLVENSLNFDPKEIKRMIDIGYRDADNFIDLK